MEVKVFVSSGPMELQEKVNAHLRQYKEFIDGFGLKVIETNVSYHVVVRGRCSSEDEYHALMMVRTGK